MLLADLLPETVTPKGFDADLQIMGLTADSRMVREGYIFAAFKGGKFDGASFIDEAVAKGACLVLANEGVGSTLPVLQTAHPRQTYAGMVAKFFKYRPANIVAVTGTNGKTSVAEFYRQIVSHLGQAAASMGTIGVIGSDVDGAIHISHTIHTIHTNHTSPEAVALHACLRDLHFSGITYLAMEASSHGLSQYRMDGVRPKAAAFTNLTREHLDYHKTQAAYFDAKARLFCELLEADGIGVINIDGACGEQMLACVKGAQRDVLTVGMSLSAQLRAMDIVFEPEGMRCNLLYKSVCHQVSFGFIGRFQIENILCAIGLALASGFDFASIVKVLPVLEAVKGRLEKIGVNHAGAFIYVDYAHTPDALEQVLINLRAHCAGQLICVFGCGGARDTGKRAQMGKIAARLADTIIVTNDNPRHEAPEAIRAEILAACPNASQIGARDKAIAQAIDLGQRGDIIVVAGKGHETGQIIGDQILPFSDHEEILKIIGGGAQ